MKMGYVLHKAYFSPELHFYHVYIDQLSLNLDEALVLQGVYKNIDTHTCSNTVTPFWSCNATNKKCGVVWSHG